MDTELNTVGRLIQRYREAQDWTQQELADLLQCDRAHLSRLERGERPITAEIAIKLDEVFHFDPEDREFFYAKTSLAPFADRLADFEREHRSYAELEYVQRRSPYRSLLSKADYCPRWAVARLEHLWCDMRRAVPAFERVVQQAENDTYGEFLGIILLDMADAYALAGQLEAAEVAAVRSERVSVSILKSELVSPRVQRRTHMGMARTIVLQQEIAYERGDDDQLQALHRKAILHLSRGTDNYGWTKSFYFLSLFRFHQGRLDEAEALGRQANEYAKHIGTELDPWWMIRDGLFLGAHWWQLHTLALLLDILASKGKREELSSVYEAYREAKRQAFWARDLPPFVPRQWWKIDEARPSFRGEQTFAQWVDDAKRLGCMLYFPDMLIAWGDFVRDIRGDRQSAAEKYRQARLAAAELGFGLLLTVAEQRLSAL